MQHIRRSHLLSVVFAFVLCAFLSPRFARAAASAPAFASNAMVTTSQVDATQAGLAMLHAGGNAVDAAVAAGLALCVTQPNSTGIGGGAFLLIRSADGEVVALDARETAPAAATRDMYVAGDVAKDASLFGPLAVATPGLIAGFAEAHRVLGKLPWRDVVAPSIALAEQGYEVGPYQARVHQYMGGRGLPGRFAETARIFFPRAPDALRAGWKLRQPELARTLRAVAEEGRDGFYRGVVADAIVSTVQLKGGLLTAEDLIQYRPKRRPPVRGTYRGYEILSFPPPSSGGVALVEALNILEGFDLAARPAGSSASLHLISEALKFAFADRAAFLGDPDFVDVPVAGLTSKQYARGLAARINPPWWKRAPWRWFRGEVAARVAGPGEPPRGTGTTHLSVTDAHGNAVSITLSVNTPFGSWVTVPGTGVVLNNHMDDFAKAINTPNEYGLLDTRGANAIAPGKRPLSSMSPTLVLKDGKPFMVTGSPGGPRIISTTLQTIVNVVDYGMDVQAAVAAPRFHHQWSPNRILIEEAVPEDVERGLTERGHEVVRQRDWSAANAIVIDPETGLHYGGSDPRRDGLAEGY